MKNIKNIINGLFEETVAEFGLSNNVSICFKTDGDLCQEYLTENISDIVHQSLMDFISNFYIGPKLFDCKSSIYYRGGCVRIYGSKLICKYDQLLRYYDSSNASDEEFISMLSLALRFEMGSIAHLQSLNGLSVEEYERMKRSYDESMDDFISNGASIRDITSIPEWSEAIRISGLTMDEIEKYSDILFDF